MGIRDTFASKNCGQVDESLLKQLTAMRLIPHLALNRPAVIINRDSPSPSCQPMQTLLAAAEKIQSTVLSCESIAGHRH